MQLSPAYVTAWVCSLLPWGEGVSEPQDMYVDLGSFITPKHNQRIIPSVLQSKTVTPHQRNKLACGPHLSLFLGHISAFLFPLPNSYTLCHLPCVQMQIVMPAAFGTLVLSPA